MKSTPVKGTRDFLPNEVQLRDYMQEIILGTYRAAGYERITTPIIESAENLDKSDGGENLNLIFKILKRGQKLESAIQAPDASEKTLSDLGLRYDLTLPLSRYFANNQANLITPFKVIQTDKVYRAERPQKGRLREFTQCDIDIIGNPNIDAEIDLILTTSKALKLVGIENFVIKISDRHILNAIFKAAGFTSDFEKLAIIFDKLDKIGIDGIKEELTSENFDEAAITKFISFFEGGQISLDTVKEFEGAAEYADNLINIINTVAAVSDNTVKVEFSPSLVRGQGYYTGTIFEVEAEGYSGAVAGGGRYDNLIGKFLKESIPAVGFSIGFERIFGILMERDNLNINTKKKIAMFYDMDNQVAAFKKAEELRETYSVSCIVRPKKLGKYLNKLEGNGFNGYVVFGEEGTVKLFENK